MEIIKTLPYIQSFLYVVDFGSFAEAARKLSTTTPTVSKQVSKLEDLIGFQLLLRTTRKLALTDDGVRFYDQCKRLYEEIGEVQGVLSEIKEAPSGRLKVVCARYFAKNFVIPHLQKFLKKYPLIHLDLELAERMPDLEKEHVDLLIGMSISQESPQIIQKRVMTTEYVFTAAPKYLKQWGKPKKPADLAHHHYLTHSMRRPGSNLQFPTGESVPIKPYIAVNDAETLLELAVKGLGILKTHRYIVQKEIESGRLVEILGKYAEKDIPIYIAYPQRRMISRKLRCFIDHLTSGLPRDWRH